MSVMSIKNEILSIILTTVQQSHLKIVAIGK